MKKIAYFINQYPKVSHSFVRREINALERLGFSVERFALRSDASELVDDQDMAEFDKTFILLNVKKFLMCKIVLASFIAEPILFFQTLLMALCIGWRSDRGLIHHVFYFVEACILNHYLKERAVGHVHAHFGTNSTTVVMLSGKLGGIPYSFTVHGPEEFDKPEFLSLGKKIQHSAFTVGISSYGRSQLYRWVEHSHWHKIHIVHCGLDSDFYNLAQLSSNFSSNIVCVGRLCEQKGQLLLVQAIAELVSEGVSLHLTLAGDGPMRAEVEAYIKKHELESNVSITGWISSSQVRDEILNARALVLPSFAEGLPVAIMEAMALQRPVVSTYVAGIPELVKPDNGWLVPAGDIEILKATIHDVLLTTDNELESKGIKAREIVIDRHNIDHEAGKLGALFTQSLAGELY